MNIKATNKYLSEKVGTTVFSCQPHDWPPNTLHDWPKLWNQGSFQSCNVFVWTSGDLVVCVRNSSHRSFVPCYGYFENTLWRKVTCPYPPVRPSACYAHSPVLNKYRVWRTKKVVKRRKEIYVPLFGLLLCKSLVWITNPNKYEFVSDEYISPVNMTKVSFNAIINTWNMI